MQITTIVISSIFTLAVIHNPAYAQTPQNPCYPLYQDPYFGYCKRPSDIYLPPVSNRALDVLIKTEPEVLSTNATEDKILHIKFFDRDTDIPIRYLSFILNVTKGDQRLISDRFLNINGTSTINFQDGDTVGKWEVFADQYFTQGWINYEGPIVVKAPIFHEPGLYHISLTIDNPNDRTNSSDKIKYNSYVKVDKNNFEVIPSSPLKQFKSGIPAQDIQCATNFILIIKSGNNSPICVRPDTYSILMKRGWATHYIQTKGTELVEMMVIRITNNTGVSDVNYTAVKTVSPEVLTKYLLVQSALQGADRQLNEYKTLVSSECHNTLPCTITAAYSTEIPFETAKRIFADPYLNFSSYPSSPSNVKISYVNVSGITYIIYLYFPQ